MGTSTKGSNTLVKTSMSSSRARMWQYRVWHALMLFHAVEMPMRIGTRNRHIKMKIWKWEEKTYGWKQACNKWTRFWAHFNEGLECERMHPHNCLKCPSSLGHNQGGHVHPIVEDILLQDIDAFLQEFFEWGVKLEGPLSKKCV